MLYKAVLGGYSGRGFEGLWREGVSKLGRSLAAGFSRVKAMHRKGEYKLNIARGLGRYVRDWRKVIRTNFRRMIKMHMMGRCFLFNIKGFKSWRYEIFSA